MTMRYQLPPIVRTGNPITSHEAAERITRNGTRQTHGELVLTTVKTEPGMTAAELGRVTGLGHVETQRRLSDLMRQGLVERRGSRLCSQNGTRMSLWYVARRQATIEDFLP